MRPTILIDLAVNQEELANSFLEGKKLTYINGLI
jgi:hypothetical protein